MQQETEMNESLDTEFETVVENGQKVLYKISYVAGSRRLLKKVAQYPIWAS